MENSKFFLYLAIDKTQVGGVGRRYVTVWSSLHLVEVRVCLLKVSRLAPLEKSWPLRGNLDVPVLMATSPGQSVIMPGEGLVLLQQHMLIGGFYS